MSDQDIVDDAVERLEWDERKEEDSPVKRLASADATDRADRRRGGDRGDRARGVRLEQQLELERRRRRAGAATFGSSHEPPLRDGQPRDDELVLHRDDLRMPGRLRADRHLVPVDGLAPNSIVNQMVSAFNSAIAAKADGIGCCLIDNTAFNTPVDTALSKGIPVIAYNADVSPGTKNNRMAYIGQNNLTAGAAVGQAILNDGRQVGRPRRRDHRDAGDGEHPAADRRREARPAKARASSSRRSGPRRPRARPSTTRSPRGTPGTRTSSG